VVEIDIEGECSPQDVIKGEVEPVGEFVAVGIVPVAVDVKSVDRGLEGRFRYTVA
jgi:hypothetical protein